MNVLQITPIDVYPPTTGGEKRMHGLVTAFSDYGHSVRRVCQGGVLSNNEGISINREIQICDGYTEIRPLNPLHDIVNLLSPLGIPPCLFLAQSKDFWRSNVVKNNVNWADVIIVEGPWQVAALRKWADDVPVIYSSHNVEADRDLVEKDNRWYDWVKRRTISIEAEAVATSSAIICTSKSDKLSLSEKYNPGVPVLVASNGTDLPGEGDQTNHPSPSEIREQYSISDNTPVGVFVGSNYPPNNEAAKTLVTIADEVNRQGVDFHLIVVGSCGSTLSDTPSNVTSTGFVESIDPYLRTANIGLNAVMEGAGTNVKMFDYLAYRLPVVSTEFGVRGIDVRDSEEVVVSSLDSFVTAIIELLKDRERQSRIGEAARAFVAENYTWKAISADLCRRLEDMFDS